MSWLEHFLATERQWLEEARTRGFADASLEVASRLLDRLEAAQTRAETATFTVSEASQITGLHPDTIRRKARKGAFGTRKGHTHIQLTRADVTKLGSKRVVNLVEHFRGT